MYLSVLTFITISISLLIQDITTYIGYNYMDDQIESDNDEDPFQNDVRAYGAAS